MKRLLSLPIVLLACVVISAAAHAAFVENMPIEFTQPDGTKIEAYVTGDEFYRSVHDKDGFTIVQDSKTGCYTYAVRIGDDIGPSAYVVGKADPVKLKLVANVRPSSKLLAEYREERLSVFGLPQRSIEYLPPTPSTLNNIVIFVRFSGESEFGDTVTAFQNLITTTGSGVNSLRAYYREASYNLLDVSSTFYPAASGGMVVSTVDSHPRGYYRPYSATNTIGYTNSTERNTRHTALLKNAALAVASQVPASLNIDRNNDGNIDDVCYIFSGTSDAWADLLWPCCGALSGDAAYINGKRVWTFNQQFRDWLFGSRAVGVLAHEMFHALGGPDLYHYDEAQSGLQPAGRWDLMENDQNPPQHMTAYMKWKYGGWISSIPQITSSGTYTLHPITSSTNNCYKIASPYSTTEFFVVEYRRKTGTFENSVPGSGLIVYRINTTVGDGNADGPPDELYIYRPGGTTTLNGSPGSAHLSETVGRTQINDYTSPKSFLTSGVNGGLDISNVGSPGDTITFQVGLNQALTPSFSPDGGIYSSTQTVTVTCATPGATIRYTTDGTEPTTSSPTVASGGTISVTSARTIKAKAWATGVNPSFTKSAKYAIQNRVYVDADSPGPTLDGISWATAFHSVQDGIDVANTGVEVWVASGTYVENITVKTDQAVYGGFKGTETSLSQRNWAKNVTILDGGHQGSVVSIPSSATSACRIDGFTIQNGTGTVGYDGKRNGGGIITGYSVAARISCNIFKSNSADQGGAIFGDDMTRAEIYNNVICSNTATDGAAIFCHGEAMEQIIGNTIAYNTGSGNGGAVYIDDIWSLPKVTIRNNMIAWNSSGIFVHTTTSPVVENNCLWGNTSYAYQGMPDQTGLNGNTSAYPIFRDSAAGDYHLNYGSGGIDAGSNMNIPSIYDRDGGNRAWDGNQDGTAAVDCGAYEFRRIYVKYDSPGVQDGSSWTRAFHSVQTGLNNAVSPDEVWVARGTYAEHITLKDNVPLYGGFAGTETYLGSRFWWQNETVLDGAGTTGPEVAVPVDAGPSTRLDGFTVRNGNSSMGGGIWCGDGSSATIANNVIGLNTAQNGAGIFCTQCTGQIIGNLFASNTATTGGGAIYLSHAPVTVSYNTIVANTAPSGGGGIVFYACDPTISSNVVAFNSQGVWGVAGTPVFTNNNVYGNTSGNFLAMADPTGSSGNISADPGFAARADGDYHLMDGSPCIDSARDSDQPLSDIEGRGKNIDGNGDGIAAADMGAYEFRRIYVKWNSSAGMYDGTTWTTAYHTIANGLNAARSGDEVWVAGGTYNERITLNDGVALYGGFGGGETARSRRDCAANPAIIDAGYAGTAVTVPDESRASTRIDGFTILHGQTTLAGGGIYIGQHSKICIANNRINANTSSRTAGGSGGGIYSYIASPTIVNNVITGNSASTSTTGTSKGGGLYLYGGAPTVINNTIAGNSSGALRIPGHGGGIYLDSTNALLRNNIVAFNSSGIYRNTAGAPSLDHNDVYGNASYNYSNVSAGTGDISSDPLFVNQSTGDYHLLNGSLCIDHANATGAPALDLDAFPRPLDGNGDGVAAVDIGAYEVTVDLASGKRTLADGQPVALSGLAVTACFEGDLNLVYVEKPDRSAGIQVQTLNGPFTVGQIVNVSGVMATSITGERYVNAIDGSVSLTGGTLVLEPLGQPNKTVGGSANGLQMGLPDSAGANNIGLLVRTWGKVTCTEPGFAAIDDGSGRVSYMATPGLRMNLYAASGLKLWPGQIVEVTGISSISGTSSADRCSVLLPRSTSDIRVLRTPTAYIYNWDTSTATNVKALLDSEDFPTDLINVSNAATTDFSKYALILISQDSGTWADTAAVASVNGSGKPIVGIETGGSNFFGKLGLSIATSSYYTGNAMMARQSASPIFHQPYEITISPIGAITVSTNASGWYGYKVMGTIPTNVEAFGSRTTDSNAIVLARENGRYLFWPFRDKPDLLTADGKHLFVNACWYALR